MDLAELILTLKDRGDMLFSWYGVETNVESVSELKDENGNFSIELKTCNSDKNLQELTWQDVKRIVNIADEIIRDEFNNDSGLPKNEETYYTEVLKRFKEDGDGRK